MPGLRADKFLLRLAIKDDNLLSVVDEVSDCGDDSATSGSDLGDDSSTTSSLTGLVFSCFSSLGSCCSTGGVGCFFLGRRLLSCGKWEIFNNFLCR